MGSVLFTCLHGSGCSPMAAGFFNAYADSARVQGIAASARPAAGLNADVVLVMLEMGIDLRGETPRLLTADMLREALLLVTMDDGAEIPPVTFGKREAWFPGSLHERGLEGVRRVRNRLRRNVILLVEHEGWGHKLPP